MQEPIKPWGLIICGRRAEAVSGLGADRPQGGLCHLCHSKHGACSDTQMPPTPWRDIPKLCIPLTDIPSSPAAGQSWGRFPVGLAGSHPGDTGPAQPMGVLERAPKQPRAAAGIALPGSPTLLQQCHLVGSCPLHSRVPAPAQGPHSSCPASSRAKQDPPAQRSLTVLVAGDRDVVDSA